MELLSIIGIDKIAHFIVGIFIAIGGCLVLPGFIETFILVVLVAGGKETYDKFHKNHSSEFLDFFATILGGLFGIYLMKYMAG